MNEEIWKYFKQSDMLRSVGEFFIRNIILCTNDPWYYISETSSMQNLVVNLIKAW